jgi:hypothetical protein
MKLPKSIRFNYWYISRKVIVLTWFILIAFYVIGVLLLNLINLIQWN